MRTHSSFVFCMPRFDGGGKRQRQPSFACSKAEGESPAMDSLSQHRNIGNSEYILGIGAVGSSFLAPYSEFYQFKYGNHLPKIKSSAGG
jgi:hypothetical protein